ncbi:MAG: HD-GYP domain-containing protein [Calditerrivibrio sp.]|nr:HD-GYP domain-containing protein [Calditerrivibrio sp.]
MLKAIPIDSLKLGMTVLKCDKEWLKLPFFGKPLESDEFIKILKNYGVEKVFISVEENLTRPEIDTIKEVEHSIDQKDLKKYSATIEEVGHIQRMHKNSIEIVYEIMGDIRANKNIYYEDITIVVDNFLEECFKKPTLVASIARIKDSNDYEISHAMNVSILNMALARKMGFDIDQMKLAGVGGLLHDVGKVKIPEYILKKPAKLTEEEYQMIKKHPEYGYEMLKGRFPTPVLEAVLFHHEKSDGSGYPKGLKEMSIPKIAKITSVSDVYDAITSDKAYRNGKSAPQAIQEMLKNVGLHFNNLLIKMFIEILGGYPSGTVVLLDTGEIAVVFKENIKEPQYPLVIVVTDKEQKKCAPYLFDLNEYNLLTKKHYKTILTALDAKKYNIEPNDIIGEFVNNTSLEARYG